MLRMLLIVAFLFAPFGASAATDDDLKTAFDRQHMACKQGEDENGALSADAIAKACGERAQTTNQLQKRGYCWDNGEQQWYGCGAIN